MTDPIRHIKTAVDVDRRAEPPRLIMGCGASSHVTAGIPDRRPAASRVLVVASATRYAATELHKVLDQFDVACFSGFSPNPQLDDVLVGCRIRDDYRPDAIVGIGGGSALDTAKMIRLLPAHPDKARECINDNSGLLLDEHIPLTLIPTTAGSGSEMTRFATVFVNGVKNSLDHPRARPELALVDPDLLSGCPPALLHICAFDTLCHAAESYWSCRSTERSRDLALDALIRVTNVLTATPTADDPEIRLQLAKAANTAGAAIDLTRTTAAHAFAYRLTSHHDVPHGLACLLNLIWLLPYNFRHAGTATTDPRGAQFVRARISEICAVLGGHQRPGLDAATAVLLDVLRSGDFPTRLSGYGISRRDIHGLVKAGLASGRASNNPTLIDPEQVTAILTEMC